MGYTPRGKQERSEADRKRYGRFAKALPEQGLEMTPAVRIGWNALDSTDQSALLDDIEQGQFDGQDDLEQAIREAAVLGPADAEHEVSITEGYMALPQCKVKQSTALKVKACKERRSSTYADVMGRALDVAADAGAFD